MKQFLLVAGVSLACLIPACPTAAQDELPAINEMSGRDFLRGISLQAARDGSAWDPSEELMHELLSRVVRIRPAILNRLAMKNSQPDWRQVIDQPDAFRGQLIHGRGKAIAVEAFMRDDPVDRRGDFFRVRVESDSGELLDVVVRQIPAAWNNARAIDEAVSFDGYFLRLAGTDPAIPLVVGDRPAWHPESTSTIAAVHDEQAILARGLVDVGRFQELAVPEKFAKPLDHADSYSLQQVIHTADTQSAALEEEIVESPLDIVELFQQQSSRHGQAFEIEGNVQRVTRIDVNPADSSALHRLTHYYQIDVFVDIDEKTLRFIGDDGKSLVFDTQYPVTIVSRSLPSWLSTGSGQNVRISAGALFARVWSYQSAYSRRVDEQRRQQSPLLVAFRFDRIESTSSGFSTVLTVGILALVVLLTALVAGFWLSDRNRGPLRSRSAGDLPDQLQWPPEDSEPNEA